MKKISLFLVFVMLVSNLFGASSFQAINTSDITVKSLTSTYQVDGATATFTGAISCNGLVNTGSTTNTSGAISGSSATLTGTLAADGNISTVLDLTVTGNDITFGNAETISNATNGSIKFTDGTNTLATIVDDGTAGSLNLGNTNRKISDDGTNFELDFSTNVNINANLLLNIGNAGTDFNSSGGLTTAAGITATTGNIGATAGNVQGLRVGTVSDTTVYSIDVSTSLAATEEFTLALADGKKGCFTVIMGTYTAQGSFTTAGAVTLTTESSPDTSTTNGTGGKLNVYDGGTAVIVENGVTGAGETPTFVIYKYEN